VLAQAVTVAVQLPLAFATALIFGFQSPGSLLLAVIIGMLLSLSATGLGFLSACFAHNDGEAATIGTLWMMPLVFLSGAIFPMPPLVIAQIGAQKISLYDLMPSTHAAEAMRRVLVYGEGPAALWYPLAGLALLSVLILMLGAWVYQRRMLRSSSL
jgi:ABC-type polysaccharide/polyol phosphate export permease